MRSFCNYKLLTILVTVTGFYIDGIKIDFDVRLIIYQPLLELFGKRVKTKLSQKLSCPESSQKFLKSIFSDILTCHQNVENCVGIQPKAVITETLFFKNGNFLKDPSLIFVIKIYFEIVAHRVTNFKNSLWLEGSWIRISSNLLQASILAIIDLKADP